MWNKDITRLFFLMMRWYDTCRSGLKVILKDIPQRERKLPHTENTEMWEAMKNNEMEKYENKTTV